MFISPAFAQGATGGGSGIGQLTPLVLIFVIFYFLLIRPQQKARKDRRAMLDNLRRGDDVITGGGIIGKVTKVNNDTEVTVEIAENVKVTIARSTITAVIGKQEGSKAGAADTTAAAKPGGLLGMFFGGKK